MEEDWHETCQAMYEGVEGAECEHLNFKFADMNKEVECAQPKWEPHGQDVFEDEGRQSER